MDSINLTGANLLKANSRKKQTTDKVLTWLEENISTLNGSCDCCRSKTSCSFHASSCLAVRGKVLEDRLIKLNMRRRTLEQRNEELEERRKRVMAMAMKLRMSSGSTLDGMGLIQVEWSAHRDSLIPDIIPRQRASSWSHSECTGQDEDLGEPVNNLIPHKSRNYLQHTIRSAFKKMASIVRFKPEMRTMTTQTSSSLLTGDTIHADLSPPEHSNSGADQNTSRLVTHYKIDGLKCTWC